MVVSLMGSTFPCKIFWMLFYPVCGAECESVVHVLWECTVYSSSGASFTEKL